MMRDLAQFGVHLHHGGVRGVAERAAVALRLVAGGHLQPARIDRRGQVLRAAIPGARDLLDRDASRWRRRRRRRPPAPRRRVPATDARRSRRCVSASSRHAVATAPPAITAQREPQVPVEYGVSAVSPCTTMIFSSGRPRISCATCASVVSSPWPCDLDADAQFQAAVGRHARDRLLEAGDHRDAPAGIDRGAVRAPARRRSTGRRRCGADRLPAAWRARMAGRSIAATTRRRHSG